MADSRITSPVPLLHADAAAVTAVAGGFQQLDATQAAEVRRELGDGHIVPEVDWWRDWRPESTAYDRARAAEQTAGGAS